MIIYIKPESSYPQVKPEFQSQHWRNETAAIKFNYAIRNSTLLETSKTLITY